MIVSRVCSHCGEVCRDVAAYAAHLTTDHGYRVGEAAMALGLVDAADGTGAGAGWGDE